MLIYFFAVASFFGIVTDEKIINHFKEAPNKENFNQIDGIDFIYVINLDKRPEKWANTALEFQKYGLKPYRFSAVNGWELSIEAVNDLGLVYRPGMTPLMSTNFVEVEKKILQNPQFMSCYDRVYFSFGTFLGHIGCTYSHLSVLFDAFKSGYETIWLCEDDVVLQQDPHQLPVLIKELDSIVGQGGWDILFTDPDQYVKSSGIPKRPNLDCSVAYRYSKKFTDNSQIHPHFKKTSSRYGTYSMIIRRSGMVKILNYFMKEKMYNALDEELMMVPNLNKFGLTFNLVYNPPESLTNLLVKGY